ncbi:hypothetical protein INR49_027191 [Caranx melampygus]|nr:hypothetical protein INR49_027191 [Caranx melampygus]
MLPQKNIFCLFAFREVQPRFILERLSLPQARLLLPFNVFECLAAVYLISEKQEGKGGRLAREGPFCFLLSSSQVF